METRNSAKCGHTCAEVVLGVHLLRAKAVVLLLQESLKMQAAGKRKQAGKGARSSARASADAATAGPGLQNDPGEYNCFLNVIVQCLWHCTAFRDAFLSLPRKVVKVCRGLAMLICSMPTAQWRRGHWSFVLQQSQPR